MREQAFSNWDAVFWPSVKGMNASQRFWMRPCISLKFSLNQS